MNSSEAMSDLERRIDAFHMARALRLAEIGRGSVEPNPLVGCIIAHGAEIIGEGWHERFGGPHAEVEALAVAGGRAAGATMYVTLEPCCHQGKTPPCSQAVIAAGLRRVVVAQRDPFPQVDGGGIAALLAAGTTVEVGLREDSARTLNAPYLKLLATGRPWVIAKWAMTLDGKIAARGGSSKWISGEASRRVAHALRGRVDAIVVGRGTAAADDPLLTARPSGPRVATRVVLDTAASLSSDSQLVRTARQTPTLVVVGPQAAPADRQRLEAAGCEILLCDGETPRVRVDQLLAELGRRQMTNILVEGGGTLLGSLLDAGQIDEVHAFIAPKLVGGATAPVAIAGEGFGDISQALALVKPQFEPLDGDLYVHGHVARPPRGGTP